MNEDIPLKYGYVGVVNRSKKDLINGLPMKELLEKEKMFFENHPVYSQMIIKNFGANSLIQKLSLIYFKMIKENLPVIIKSINEQIRRAEDDLSSLGEPLPEDEPGKLSLILALLNKFTSLYINVIKGKYDERRKEDFLSMEGGHKILKKFSELLINFTGNYIVTKNLTDSKITDAIISHGGDSFPGFPSVDAFYFLLRPKLDELKAPIDDCFNDIYDYLENLAEIILEKSLVKFPRLIEDISELVKIFLNKERDKTKKLVNAIFNQEVGYLFTNDIEYINNHTHFISPSQIEKIKSAKKGEDIDRDQLFISEVRERLEAYFKVCVRNLRENIPKAIGFHLLKSIENNMQIELYDMLYKTKDIILPILDEPTELSTKRKIIKHKIDVMNKAQKIIRRDPDLLLAMELSSSDVNYEKNKKRNSKRKGLLFPNITIPDEL